MTFITKNLTNLTLAALMVSLAAWAILQATAKSDANHIVGVVEVSEVP